MWLLMDVAPPTDVILRVTTQAPNTVIQTITQVSVQKKSTIFRFSFLWKYVTVILHVFNAPWGNKSFEDISN